MDDFAVVAIGYNRTECLFRLLNSLNNADYNGDTVPLIISIDNSGTDAVYRIAEEFKWEHGEKIIRTYPERLGLRRHILTCGDICKDYKHIAVFEDDLYASDSFYHFAKQAVKFYDWDDRIAGIALYSHHWDQNSNRPFLPIGDQYDAYFMQYACSWGQVWSRSKWENFINWYNENDGDLLPAPDVPQNVTRWANNSWLKYHIKYCIETNRFFVYPRVALSTNFGDQGQHNYKTNNGYQVPLQSSYKRNYIFPSFNESGVKYDAFFELIDIGEKLQINNDDVCVDLYGMKKNRVKRRYWLTMELADYKIVRSFDMSMRPHEMNVIENIDGNIIKLYDTSISTITKKAPPMNLEKLKVRYDIKNVSYKTLFKYSLMTIFERIKEKINGVNM
jgi:hypothetical protein